MSKICEKPNRSRVENDEPEPLKAIAKIAMFAGATENR